MTLTLNEIIKDSAYKLTQFSAVQIQALESSITVKDTRGKPTPYVVCLVRNKEIKLTPEEVVRQLYLKKLKQEYGYSYERIECEYAVKTGSSSKRADIVIFDVDHPTQPYIIVELKQPKVKDGKEQLKSYCRYEGASIGVWTNGDKIEYFFKKQDPKSKTIVLDALTHLPTTGQTLSAVLNERFTIKDLLIIDKLESKSLRDIIHEFEDVVLANSGENGFEEIFKLIFTKLFDEFQSGRDKDSINTLLKHNVAIKDIEDKDFRLLEFRNSGTEAEAKKRIEKLFTAARNKWAGIFPEDDSFALNPWHLSTCVSYLQDIKLFNSNLEIIDDAFEYLVNQESKGNKGQYFTPRYVIDMCIKMLNPQAEESLIDTAAGSCGFPMHSIFYVWQHLDPDNTNLFTTDKRTQAQIDYVQEKVFAIDFSPLSVRVGRALNLIAGDGQTNVLRLNTLDYKRWNETISEQKWVDIYNEGFKKLKKLRPKGCDEHDYKNFEFDVLMANPPFAGEITDETLLSNYQLSKNAAGKHQMKVGRDILFIERNLNFLKPGGRMAVVLPQGRFNNSSDKQIREFIAGHCRILAVVGLHGNVFKPHTGTKTSVLFVQKWDDTLCPKVDDYPIFFATMQEPSKDNSGDKIYVKRQKVSTFEVNNNDGGFQLVKYEQADFLKKYGSIKEATIYEFQLDGKKTRMNLEQIESRFDGLEFVENPVNLVAPIESNELVMDAHGHLIVKHDLFNHDGLTQDGIAEAFIEFAKKERLSFFA